jgi:hypothetical protein
VSVSDTQAFLTFAIRFEEARLREAELIHAELLEARERGEEGRAAKLLVAEEAVLEGLRAFNAAVASFGAEELAPIPAPGSPRAVAIGCGCDGALNDGGRGAVFANGTVGHVVDPGCWLHRWAPPKEPA